MTISDFEKKNSRVHDNANWGQKWYIKNHFYTSPRSPKKFKWKTKLELMQLFFFYHSKYLSFLFKAANKYALVPTKNTYKTQNQKVYLLKTSDNYHIGQSFI